MSTEAAVIEPPVKEAAKPEVKAPVSLLSDLKIAVPADVLQQAETEEKKPDETPEEKTEEEKKPEEVKKPATEEKVPEVVKEEKTAEKPAEKPPMSEAARTNFARVEKDRDEARTRAETLAKELEKVKAESTQAIEAAKRAQQLEQENLQLKAEIKAAFVERDPEFISQFDKPRQSRMDALKTLAASAKATPEQFEAAMKNGDEDTLDELRENLSPANKRAWDAHLAAITDLEFQRSEALKNSSQTADQIQKKRVEQYQQQIQQQTEQNVKIADSVITGLFEQINEPSIKDNPELQNDIRSALHAVAGGEGAEAWTSEQILKHVGIAYIQKNFLQIQKGVIDKQHEKMTEMETKLKEAQDKLAEQEAFIKKVAGGVPRGEVTSAAAPSNGKPKSILDEVRVMVPGQTV